MSPPPSFDLKPGTEPVPGHRLIKRIGQGGFAEVWEAINTSDNTRLALKFLDCKHQKGSLIVNEIKLLIQLRDLKHDNLLQFYSVTTGKNLIILSMELAEGSLNDLHYIYRTDHRSHLPADVLMNLMNQAAVGIDFIAHQKFAGSSALIQHGMQHCDIKPSNLLLINNTVKVADFGLSGPQMWNARGKAFGTPPYAPPELYEGRANSRTDQFSLAVTYVELRTGYFPFPVPSDGSCPTVAPELTMLPEAERSVLAQALSKQWLNRFNSCQEFVSALSKVVAPGNKGLPFVRRSSSLTPAK
ncbi:MAG TPA: serine/threonine-protein kinase [Gemmatales bacterium]|nr:serine/threonine-protein kinase [Gemmatales bacterium]